MSAESASDAEYTSVSVALSQTLEPVPAITAAAIPATGQPVHRARSQATIAPALVAHSAENRFTIGATGAHGTRCVHALAARTNSGVPGGCGMPSVWIAARNSPASQKVTDGASVAA